MNEEKTPQEVLTEALDHLDKAKFNFCIFCDAFKRYIEKEVKNGSKKDK